MMLGVRWISDLPYYFGKEKPTCLVDVQMGFSLLLKFPYFHFC